MDEQLENATNLLTQRDELLAALKAISEEFGNNKPRTAVMGKIAEDAIAKFQAWNDEL
jgi:hypothetical protein